VISRDEFQEWCRKHAGVAFDNEHEFIAKFFAPAYTDVIEVSFTSESVRVLLLRRDGGFVSDKVGIGEFLEWVDQILANHQGEGGSK
jgi:hypothetical protein